MSLCYVSEHMHRCQGLGPGRLAGGGGGVLFCLRQGSKESSLNFNLYFIPSLVTMGESTFNCEAFFLKFLSIVCPLGNIYLDGMLWNEKCVKK